MSRYYSSEDENRKLKDQLYFARITIIHLLKDPFSKIMKGYHSCNNREEGRQWENHVVEQVIENTLPNKPKHQFYQETAYCPLCGSGTSSYGGSGFTYPEGLKRHLEGYGNTHQCSITNEVFSLARDHWQDEFREQELIEQREKAEKTTKRMREETLYKIEPFNEPELIDRGYSWNGTRDSDGMAWAEDRLKSLGFTTLNENNVKSYVKEYENLIVFADPRSNKRISFLVFKKPLPKRKPRTGMFKYRIGHFDFQDSWKNELPKKFEKRIDGFAQKSE